jgi:hypothetical protein
VGTGESFYNIDVINDNGTLKSVDRGATWQHLASTIDDPAHRAHPGRSNRHRRG